MEVVSALLKANKFNINESHVTTKVTTLADADASDEGLSKFINACREDPHFGDYKIVPCEGRIMVAVDYNYDGSMQKLCQYADALITDDLAGYSRGHNIRSGSFKLVIEDGKLCYQYEAYEMMTGMYMRRTDPVPKIEGQIIQHALKVLPVATHPAQA